mmetsp:Transcript_142917/g.252326  ORF Transcript_142917/g.252326 Transcript_142917/m.252326 type:complete len:381 (+) Transcript_142917:75-1217(+)
MELATEGNDYDGLTEAVPHERAGTSHAAARGCGRSTARDGSKVMRIEAVWPGKSQFYCRGNCMTGEFSSAACVTWSCILVPFALYCLVVIPMLWRSLNPLIPLASFAIFLLTAVLLCLTCCSDPGVIPRRGVLLASGAAEEVSEALGYNVLGADVLIEETAKSEVADRMPHIPADLQLMGYRWCRTCEIIRPPRASHCPDCDHCVLRFDHHCPFVNNCVGQRNYHFFVGFITSAICLAIFVLPALLWWASAHPLSASGSNRGQPQIPGDESDLSTSATKLIDLGPLEFLIISISAAAGITSVVLLGFLGYHFFLIVTGKTTKEHWRRSARTLTEEAEPTLWAPRGPRLFNPRSWVSTEALHMQKPRRAAGCEAGVELMPA